MEARRDGPNRRIAGPPAPEGGAASAFPFWKASLAVVSVSFSLRYLVWRATGTLNYSSDGRLLVSLLLLAAEAYGFVSVLLYFLQVFSPAPAAEPVPMEGEPPTVDLFVTVCNEPVEILRRTLIACRALDYPADRLTLYVLDDGRRPEVAELAARHGARWVTRPDRSHAKAGNLNHGLTVSRGEFVMLLDVDHLPVSSFLRETLGFFREDPRLAFVQTPHHFYNPDCYQRNLILEAELVHEQDLFFQVIQPSRSAANAVVFAGSSAVFRRAALEDAGGFRTDCAIEDMHTGMELQARGWTSRYHNRVLSAGLSPEDFAGYLTQRRRWTRGGVQLFFLDNPLVKSGLGPRQRLFYFASLHYFFHAWARLVYLVVPLSFLLFHADPIVAGTRTLVAYFLPHYVFSHLAFNALSGEHRSPFWSDVYETACAFALSWTAFATMFTPASLVFDVTPKGLKALVKERFQWRGVLPHAALMGLLVAGIVKATHHFMTERTVTLDSYLLSCVWAAFNFVLLACAIEVAREHPHKRRSVRLPRSFPVFLRADGRERAGVAVNLSETGALIALPDEVELPRRAVVRIDGGAEAAVLDCEVRHCRWLKGRGSRVGLRFHGVTEDARERLVRLLFCRPDSWRAIRRPDVDSIRAMTHIASTVLRKRLRRRGDAASGAPAQLIAESGAVSVVLGELRADRAVASWDPAVRVEGEATLRLPHRGRGEVLVRVRVVEPVGQADAGRSHLLRFLSPERIRLGPVLDALEAEASA